MSKIISAGKKALNITVASSMVLWSLGAVAVAPASAATLSAGDLIKASGAAVYYYSGSCRLPFPSDKVFKTWYTNFDGVKTITDAELQAIDLCGSNMTVRPGTRLVKITTDPKVYAVEPGGMLRHIASEAIAEALYGSNWNKEIDDIPDVFFTNYKKGAAVESAVPPVGSLVKDAAGNIYYVDSATTMRMVKNLAAFNDNGFQSRFVRSVADGTLSGLTKGTEIGGKEAAIAQPQTGSSTPTPDAPSGSASVAASLASDNPAGGTIIETQTNAKLLGFMLTNSGSAEAKVTGVALKRTGISNDTTLSAVYLFADGARLTDSASVSSGNISFNDASGIVTLAAGASKTLWVKANVADGTSGQTVGVSLDKLTLASGSASGMPLNGNLMSVASNPTTMATVDFNTTTTPAAATINPQKDYVMWQNDLSIANEDVTLHSIRFRQIGSVNASDIGNFRLYVDGVQAGSAVAALDAAGYVNFNLATPLTLKVGSANIMKVVGDIISGSSRTFSLSLREAADAMFVDSALGVGVLPTANSATFSARASGTQTIDTGSLTVTKASGSPSGEVTSGASNVVLAKYTLEAAGEKMKVESLRVRIDEDDADTAYTLRSGMLFANGVQVGSTAAIAGDTDATQAYTEFTFGSSLIVEPGKPVTLEVRADIFDNDGANNVGNGDTIQVELFAGANNVQRMTSAGYGTYPAAAVEGNTLTVAQSSVTVAKNTAYNDHTSVAPKTAYKIGSFTLTANTSEAANLTSVSLDLDSVADAADASDDLTNLYFTIAKSSGGTPEHTSAIKTSVTDTANSWAFSYTLDAGSTVWLDVYANVASTITDGDGTADTMRADLTVSGTGASSGVAVSPAEVNGQTVTWGAGSFSTALDGSAPLNRIVAANQEVTAATYKLTATNETYTVKEVQVKVASATVASAVATVKLYDGSTLLGTAPLAQSNNTAALFTGLNLAIPANSNKVLTAKLVLGEVGTGKGTSQVNAALTLDSVKYADSQGVETTDANDRAGNEVYVYKTTPTVAHVDLTNGTLVNGQATDVYKFTVSADAKGPVALKQLKLNVTWSDGGTADTLELESLKLYRDGVDITDNVTLQDEDGNSVEGTNGLLQDDGTLVVSWSTEETVAAGATQTYTVRATPQNFRMTGADTSGDSVSLYLLGDTTHNGTGLFLNAGTAATTIHKLHTSAAAGDAAATNHNLIWSDNSATSHVSDVGATSTGDWANGYKVLSLDLPGETWTK